MMNAADTDVTFSDMNFSDQKLVGNSEGTQNPRHGYFVTKRKAAIIVLLIILLCIIIGVSVHYAKRCDVKETQQETTPSPQEVVTSTKPPTTLVIRLPGSILPVHYDVILTPDIYAKSPEDFTFNGTVAIIIDVISSTDEIILHSNKLVINNDTIKVKPHGQSDNVPVNVDGIELIPNPYEFLRIPLKSSLAAGKKYHVEIAFSGKIENDLRGIYYSSYPNPEAPGENVYLLTSQLQATDARKVFPCFDEPAIKATFNISIDHKPHLNTKSNTGIVHQEPLSNGWVRDVYAQTPKMSTYLLAFLVSNFTCTQSHTSTGTLVEVCSRPNAIEQTQYAVSVAVDIQEWFEYYHNISYPLPKMSHVAVPDFAAGAMENWGLILYRETALLYDNLTSASAYSMQRVALIISHELAHQWFGNLVTTAWWDDIWLNEGFASFMELLGVHNVKGYSSWDVEGQSVAEYTQKVLVEDSLLGSHPVYQPVENPTDIGSLFDSITYDKGSSVIRMMKYFLGEDTFRWGLSDYLKDRQYQAANHTDLFTFLSQRAKKDGKDLDVTAIMNTWILQEGYPVVTMEFSPGDAEIGLSQTRYLLDPSAKQEDNDKSWYVPVSYMSDKTGEIDMENLTLTWLNADKSGSITGLDADTQWVLGNVKQTFYYRVNYNLENWAALIGVLRDSHKDIPTLSRSELIDDSFKLGQAGELDQTLALNVTLYLEQETEYAPWYSVHRNMRFLHRMLSQIDSDKLLEKYIQQKVRQLYNTYSKSDGTENYTHIERRLQALLWSIACKYGLESCLENATGLYQQWMENKDATHINPDYAAVVYCYGIAEGGVKEWDFAHKMYLTSNSPSQKDLLLTAMGCARNPWVLKRYLSWALDEGSHGFQRQDMRRILSGVATWPSGSAVAWEFFKANWDVYYDRFGEQSFSFSRMIAQLASHFSTDWERQDFQDFFNKHTKQGSARQQVKLSLEAINTNIEWRRVNEAKILAWLQEHVDLEESQ